MAAPLLDRQILERLERLTIRWQQSFRGLVGGHNISRYAGPGQEFLDHRNFHQGDDLRAVNWRAFMRLEKLFLKMFQVEPRTPIRLLLDSSSSMTASPEPGAGSKFDYARKLAAALTYVGLVRHDSILLQPFHEKLDDSHLASGGRHRFGPVNDFLSALEPGGRTSYFEMVRQFISAYQKPGLLILVSDFLDDGEVLKPLQYLADFGHELMLVQVWTDSDRSPNLKGDVTLTDAESGGSLEISLDEATCQAYTEEFDRYAGAIENLALRSGGRYAGFSTSVPLEEAIFSALNQAGADLQRAPRSA
ncbi:DUF58 domain-containing protein [Paludibaculum fermentans]|uniref:DUF58 domain-containing protein n=1 Tax=Paludibaculum fermentans TaxID=1473598 RepID=A0A7S7NNJ8_PALFE|nr:DUF58 domain-containing protein [Paludibaculum fermentans]QOY86900.1 DUF58 domain-containing protein [Paludibaculum fermentans]